VPDLGVNGQVPAWRVGQAEPALRRAEAEIGALQRDEAALVAASRRLLGIVGTRERIPFLMAMRVSSRSSQALLLWALAFADAGAGTATVLASHPAQLSIGGAGLGLFPLLRPAFFAVGGVGALFVLERHPGRVSAARTAAVAAAAGLVAVALSTSTVAVVIGAMTVAAASGVSAAAVLPLLFDVHRPELRIRVVGGFVAAVVAGIGTAGAVVGLAGGLGLTWRAGLLFLAAVPAIASVLAWRLADVPVGRHDRARIHRLVEDHLGGVGVAPVDLGDRDVGLTTTEQFRRVLAPASARPMLVLAGVFGMGVWALPSPLDLWLRDRWGLVGPSRGLLYVALLLATAPAVAWYAGRAEISFRQAPQHLVQVMSSLAAAAATTLALAAVSPVIGLAVVLLWLWFVCTAALLVGATFVLLSLCDPAYRGHGAVLVGLSSLVGGLFGRQLIGTVGPRFGVGWSFVSVAAVLLGAAGRLRLAITSVESDVDRLLGRIVEVQEVAVRVGQGHHLPLLSCRHVDFSYGQVQVLFDVSLTVDDAEMVALLGTNGAGKTTLLCLISGLSFPSGGSVYYRGSDITYLGADRRVQLGISQIPGGRAVFGPLSVVENLRAFGHMHGRDRSALERGIDETFAALPRLGERRNQQAATLSGGEQQMLAIGKAFILRPRLLIIDELSLGLAPIVVRELLDMVRRINAGGAAVVLVEQSVNVALSLVDHAYFMEKGEMRFDGPAEQLLARSDLLRSVFLRGATEGLKAVSPT
jgi:ABC-type branched-subunit amino acid transport system ATPase component